MIGGNFNDLGFECFEGVNIGRCFYGRKSKLKLKLKLKLKAIQINLKWTL